MPRFDALRQPWIPAENMDGTINEYGILEVIRQAPRLRNLSDPSPVFLYGMYRLLIAFLSDALRPQTIDELLEIFTSGHFPLERIEEYISQCEANGPCFDLFDEQKPFLQSAYDQEIDKQVKTVAIMVSELPTGNNPVHFDHRKETIHALCPEICAQALCSVNLFCPADAQNPSGINGAPPWYVIVRGNNLFETLLFNIWIPILEIPFDDPPVAWRNTTPVIPGKEVTQVSYLYGLTWQARRICLIPSEEGICTYSGRSGQVMVRTTYFQKGWKFQGHSLWIDPHTPRLQSDKGVGSVKPRDGRASWRDLSPLALSGANLSSNVNERAFRRPEVVNQFIQEWTPELRSINKFPSNLQIEIFGLSTNQAKLLNWIHDVLTLPVDIAASSAKSDLLSAEIEIVEQVNREIGQRIKAAGVADNMKQSVESAFFDQASSLLYGVLYSDLLQVKDDHEGWRTEAILSWRRQLRTMSRRLFDDALEKAGVKSFDLEKRSRERSRFFKQLNRILTVKEVKTDG